MSVPPSDPVQADFDRIALLPGHAWDHNNHYHAFLLRQIPPRLEAALEIGCGTGAFARLLAQHSARVLALDYSANMILQAQAQSQAFSNIEFVQADATQVEFPAGGFDCIASLATLHHLPAARMLAKMKTALRPGGVLLVLDLFAAQGLAEKAPSLLAAPLSLALRLAYTGRLRPTPAERQAWAEHAPHDHYLTLAQVRELGAEILPGARVRQHLFWRYSLVWRKPPQ